MAPADSLNHSKCSFLSIQYLSLFVYHYLNVSSYLKLKTKKSNGPPPPPNPVWIINQSYWCVDGGEPLYIVIHGNSWDPHARWMFKRLIQVSAAMSIYLQAHLVVDRFNKVFKKWAVLLVFMRNFLSLQKLEFWERFIKLLAKSAFAGILTEWEGSKAKDGKCQIQSGLSFSCR